MTAHEFRLHIDGVSRRREHDLERMAWHAAQIINHRTPAMGEKHRRPVTVDQLLGRKKGQVLNVADFGSAAAFKDYMKRKMMEGGAA